MQTDSQVMGSGNTISMKKKVKFEVQAFDVGYLVELIPKIPKDVQDQFAREYGRLSDLIRIPVDTHALDIMGVMVKYWNPQLRIFEFPNVDASPTIEEYDVLLDIPLVSRLKVYLFTDTQNVSIDLIHELIRVRPHASNIIKQGPYYGLKWSFLKKHLDQMVDKREWDLFQPAFALAIYGRVLFPFVNDMIDQCAIDVFTKFKKFGTNPVPAILADTLLALQRSLEKGIPKVRCCAQLLYVWMMTRFKHHQYPDCTRYPLQRFRNTRIQPTPLTNWEALFNEVTPRNFGTKCRMYDLHEEIMYSCGSYPNMILMGPRGCITITPALVLGQMRWGMLPVTNEQLQGFVIFYKDKQTTKETLDAIRKALRNIRIVGKNELGEHQAFYTDEYKLWRSERRIGNTPLPISPPRESSGPSEVELLKRQIRIMEAKLEEARCKIDKDELTIERRDKTIAGLKREETSLKRDYAEMCSQSEKYRLKRIVEEKDIQISSYEKQIKTQKHVSNSTITNLEAEVMQLQEDLSDSKQSENLAWAQVREYQSALDQALNKEDKLKIIHHEALTEASQKEDHLSRQLWSLKEAYDKMIDNQEVWTENWRKALRERQEEANLWENRCRHIVDELGDFADNWLRIFYDAKREVEMYPESELLPDMKIFYDFCRDIAKDLKGWRGITNKEF